MTQVDQILIIELTQELTSLTQYVVPEGPFHDGDIITYEAEQFSADFPQLFPGGILMTMVGPNRQGQQIQASWSIDYTNNCNEFPVIRGGEQTIGTIVVS